MHQEAKKKWQGKGQFFCPGMEEVNGKIRPAEVEAEDRERAEALIRVEVARKLKLDVATFARMVKVIECKEMKSRKQVKPQAAPTQHPPRKKLVFIPRSGPRPQQVPPVKLKGGKLIDI